MRARRFIYAVAVLLPAIACGERPITVAVASNFQQTARELAAAYEETAGVAVRVSAGSTGKLYGQIRNGAPFDVFLAADVERPRLLEEAGIAIAGSRRTYAIGSLLLWSRDPALAGEDCRAALAIPGKHKLAIANPRTAPYGKAAQQFLQHEGIWDSLERSLVLGENVSQALQFVATGNARLGFVAKAQASLPELPAATCSWPVPVGLHQPIEQQVVVVRDDEQARRFSEFLGSEEARHIIRSAGYLLPRQGE